MGNICTSTEREEGTETVDTHKNTLLAQATLGAYSTVDLVVGHYRQHRTDSLFVIVELKNLQYYEALRDYCANPDHIFEVITSQRKTFFPATVAKQCPYKKVLLCILPPYRSEQTEEYQQVFTNVVRQMGQYSREVTMELTSTIQGVSVLPNQMLLALLFKEIAAWPKPFKLHLVATEKKMLAMYKFELLKTDKSSFKYLHTAD